MRIYRFYLLLAGIFLCGALFLSFEGSMSIKRNAVFSDDNVWVTFNSDAVPISEQYINSDWDYDFIWTDDYDISWKMIQRVQKIKILSSQRQAIRSIGSVRIRAISDVKSFSVKLVPHIQEQTNTSKGIIIQENQYSQWVNVPSSPWSGTADEKISPGRFKEDPAIGYYLDLEKAFTEYDRRFGSRNYYDLIVVINWKPVAIDWDAWLRGANFRGFIDSSVTWQDLGNYPDRLFVTGSGELRVTPHMGGEFVQPGARKSDVIQYDQTKIGKKFKDSDFEFSADKFGPFGMFSGLILIPLLGQTLNLMWKSYHGKNPKFIYKLYVPGLSISQLPVHNTKYKVRKADQKLANHKR